MRAQLVLVLMLALLSPCEPAALPTTVQRGGQRCLITDPPYSAVGDNATEDTAAIQRALDAAACEIVVIPAPGWFVSRALNLTAMSNRQLLVEPGAVLVVWRDPATYSTTKYNNMFLSASDGDGSWTGPLLSNFTLGGGGAIHGGGAAWWPLGQTVTRPRLVWLPLCDGVRISDLSLVNSPAWNMGLRGSNILVERMRIAAGAGSCGGYGYAPNTDGFNLGGVNITVRDSTVHNGDDCIPVTTGPTGRSANVSAHNVSCQCGTNGGVIYNQGGVIESVRFTNLTVRHTNQASAGGEGWRGAGRG